MDSTEQKRIEDRFPTWESMSMGCSGRMLEPYGQCDKSPDGKHHYQEMWMVQSISHYKCIHCGDEWSD